MMKLSEVNVWQRALEIRRDSAEARPLKCKILTVKDNVIRPHTWNPNHDGAKCQLGAASSGT